MHMYCRFREPVVDLRFSRCPSFVCRCSSIFWIPQRLAVDIVIVITVDQMLSFPPLIAKQQTTDITITPFLPSASHDTAKVNDLTHAPTLRLLQPEEKSHLFPSMFGTPHSLMHDVFPSGPLVPSHFLASLPSSQ